MSGSGYTIWYIQIEFLPITIMSNLSKTHIIPEILNTVEKIKCCVMASNSYDPRFIPGITIDIFRDNLLLLLK